MRAERERIARTYRSEGNALAEEIRATADEEKMRIISEAYKEAETIKGEGDAEAIRIYADAYRRDPDFYQLVRTLEAYEKLIDKNTTIIMPADAELLKFLTAANPDRDYSERRLQKTASTFTGDHPDVEPESPFPPW